MRMTKAVECNGKTRVARELTTNEVDALFDASRERTLLDDYLDAHELDVTLLAAMLGVESKELAAELGDLPPSAYRPLLDACREVNPDFFATARRRRDLVGQMAAMERMLASASGQESASSSSAATTAPGTTD